MEYNFLEVALRSVKARGDTIKQLAAQLIKKVSQLVTKITTSVSSTMTSFLKAPQAQKDYFPLGKYLLSKRFVFICVSVWISIWIVFTQVAYPWLDGRLWTSRMELNSEKFLGFTGKVSIYDTGKVTIYEGQMQDGKIQGVGTQYDRDGELLYSGSFADNQYEGEGRYYRNHLLLYEGMFQKNQYDGEGKFYSPEGKLLYRGTFAHGMKEGTGVQYDPMTGNQIYVGDFIEDKRQGDGTVFAQDGRTIVYEGQFSQDRYEGEGRFYQDGKLLYIGAFADGVFSGEGMQYDVVTGNKIYEGGFKEGLYDGIGTQYDAQTGQKEFQGTFVQGKRDGTGQQYDALGTVIFQGNYKCDAIDLMGYLGQDITVFRTDFGIESKSTFIDGVAVLLYANRELAVLCQRNDEGTYVCWKMISGLKEAFAGITPDSTEDQVRQILGEPYSVLSLPLPTYYTPVRTMFAISLPVQTEKYMMEGYYIRVYYASGGNGAKAVEVCST